MDSEELYNVLFENERAIECWRGGWRIGGRFFDQ